MFHRDLNFIAEVVNSTPDDFDVMNYDPVMFNGRFRRRRKPMVVDVSPHIQRYANVMVVNTSCFALSKRAIGHIVDKQESMLKPFDHYTWLDTEGLNTYCVSKGDNICI